MTRVIAFATTLVLMASALVMGQPTTLVAAQHTNLTPLATQDITLDQAQEVVASAIAAAQEQGTLMDIAVVDAGGNLKAFARMDGAWLGSIDIATTKARTARYFDLPTGELGELSQPGGPLYGIEVSNGGLITFPGGLAPEVPRWRDHRRHRRQWLHGGERPRGGRGRRLRAGGRQRHGGDGGSS